MVTLTFDTLAAANRLRAAGFSDEQAAAAIDTLREAQAVLVTNDTLRQELAMLEQRMTIKLGSLIVAAVGIAAALAKLL